MGLGWHGLRSPSRNRPFDVVVAPRGAGYVTRRAACSPTGRRIRFSPTRSEERLWRRLSGSKTGFAFRRQLVIGPIIVDFACTKVRLVVEVDGPSHEGRERHDAQRDRLLAQLGWNVLRIEEHHVFDFIDHALDRIVTTATALRR